MAYGYLEYLRGYPGYTGHHRIAPQLSRSIGLVLVPPHCQRNYSFFSSKSASLHSLSLHWGFRSLRAHDGSAAVPRGGSVFPFRFVFPCLVYTFSTSHLSYLSQNVAIAKQLPEPNTPAAPLDRPSFTFIDHDDDLTSKRIRDVNARKAIRSHVMRDVRRRERLAGLKRSSRRESRTQPVSLSTREENPEERRLVLRTASQSSASSVVEKSESDDSFVDSKHRGRPVRWSAGNPSSSHLNPSPCSLPTAWFFDPFCSLPGTTELPTMVGHLVYYCKIFPVLYSLWLVIVVAGLDPRYYDLNCS